MLDDLRYVVRSLAKAPAFCALVVATLALGIGANTAVFGVIHASLLTPLPYPEPERLVRVTLERAGQHRYFPGPGFVDLRSSSRTTDLASVFIYTEQGADIGRDGRTERVAATAVSSNYFAVMGAPFALGKGFDLADERPGNRLVVVSDRIWREYMDGSADAIGRPLVIDGQPATLVGVLKDGFRDPLLPAVEIWTPENLQPGSNNVWSNNRLSAVGRLRPGASIEAARSEIETLVLRQGSNYGTARPTVARLEPLQDALVGGAAPMLLVLLAAVGLLLLLACVNVASLVLARGVGRSQEVALRTALGASRFRVIRQLLLESVALSILGGAAGALLAAGLSTVLLAAAPVPILRGGTGASAPQVFAYCFAVALVCGLACGLLPALQVSRPDLERALRQSGRGGGASRTQTRTWNALVVAQVAVALVLLVGAGLLLQTFSRLRSTDLGIQSDQVMTFQVHLPAGAYAEAERRRQFHVDFQARLAAIGGVRAAGAISRLPVTGTYHPWGLRVPGADTSVPAEHRVVEGNYFAALGIPLLRGRQFDSRDAAGTGRSVLLSRMVADRLFGSADPIGRQVLFLDEPATVIGVTGDVALDARGRRGGLVYHPHAQFAADRNWILTQVVAAADVAPGQLLERVRGELARLDPSLVLHEPRALSEVVGRGRARERFASQLLAMFAALALILAAVGLYGVLAYAVSSRRREIGIRMALGAPRRDVGRMFVLKGSRLAAAGIAIGTIAALLLGGWIQALLFGVRTNDPVVFLTAGSILLAVGVAAAWVPARAAGRVEPIEVLNR